MVMWQHYRDVVILQWCGNTDDDVEILQWCGNTTVLWQYYCDVV